jgi:ATP-binding cassette subfamily G (WHITE) protein 2 (PDR)
MQAKGMSVSSPYTLSIPMQIRLCLGRGFQRLKNDMALFFATVIGNSVITIILSSVFLNLPNNTGSFYSRSALLFWAILMNAFASALEILSLYVQRPIVEKHASQYAFYRPYAEACASMIVELPSKIITAVVTNVILYFMTNLRRDTASAFFIFFLFNFTCTLVMSMIFRTIGAATKTIHQAMPPAALFILALITYTGFTIPTRDMVPWFRWINYLNPIGYAFEALMVNEFASSQYPCSAFVPDYTNATGNEHVCSVTGAVPGQNFVDGAVFIGKSYEYYHSHLWRNFGILIGFMMFFLGTYLFATEYVSSAKSKGEVLVFKRGYEPTKTKRAGDVDEEGNITGHKDSVVDKNTSKTEVGGVGMSGRDIFMWRDVCYDIKIKKEERRLLDHVDGWVMPGTLTALMGVSGAGKTTLLDVLASRVTMGVVSGDMLVNGLQRDASFQRKTGYVQQQDLHLQTSTVREALVFSALLRQPETVSKEEKLAYVEEVIKLLDMEDYAEAVVGILGEGLNVEQRKRLTIAVELAAKPQLLLFLDEPTSGLDSQTAWSICSLMRKLANSGQAILCTIHQPSAILFQEFDRLLFLAPGGKTVYFGEIGENSQTLINYFEDNGAKPCPSDANPAEWMLEIVGDTNKANWSQIWNESPERRRVRKELARMQRELSKRGLEHPDAVQMLDGKASHGQAPPKAFAASFGQQFWAVFIRVMQQYWRTPTYIWSKAMLSTLTSLLVGFSFYQAENTLQGMQNQMFAVFMLMTVFGNLVQQIMPHFVTQRALYEVRERPSKTYSWQAFMLANICAELPWQTLMSVFSFVSFYYPIGLDRNAKWIPGELHERAGLFFLLIWVFYLFTSTFSHMVIAGIDTAENGGNIANLLFTLCLIFCGVLVQPKGFWIFMYRVSPFTYLISALLSTGIAHAPVHCSDIEIAVFDPPSGMNCQAYLDQYMSYAGGALYNGDATSGCQFCRVASTDVFLDSIKSSFDHRWRDFGLVIVYLAFNIIGALFFYWLIRVPRGEKKKEIGTVSPDGDVTPDVVEMQSLDGRENDKKVAGH